MSTARSDSLTYLIRRKLELSQEGFARLIGVSHRTVWRWEQPNGQPDSQTQEFLKRLDNVLEIKRLTMDARDIERWLSTTNAELKNFAPIELLRSEFGAATLHDYMKAQIHSRQ